MTADFFRLSKFKTSIRTELLAGLTTFSAMAYILFVNPMILSAGGLEFGSVMTATIIITLLATLSIGLLVNAPYAIAPGMGTNIFVVYSIILLHNYSWQSAMGCALIAGGALFILNALKLRLKLLQALPDTLLRATVSGIGVLLVFISLRHIGLIEHAEGSIVHFGKFLPIECGLTALGVAAIYYMMKKRVQSAFIVTLLTIWILSLLFGKTTFQGLVSLPPPLEPTFFKLNFEGWNTLFFWRNAFSIFLVLLFDSSACLLALAKLIKRDFSASEKQKMLYPDAFFSMIGPILGSGSLAIHLESAAGIESGGRTGLTSIVVATCFALSFFFYPLFASIPSFASAPILIVIGFLMIRELKQIDWKSISDAIPTILVITVMPLTFSIYLGFAVGFISYSVLYIITGRFREIHPLIGILSLIFALQFYFGG